MMVAEASYSLSTSGLHQPKRWRRRARLPALHALQTRPGFVIGPVAVNGLFPGSSVVEQPAVNRLVAGSNPARGANSKFRLRFFNIIRPNCLTEGKVRQ